MLAQCLRSTTSGNVLSASLTTPSGKTAATHNSVAFTHPRTGMLTAFPTKEQKKIGASQTHLELELVNLKINTNIILHVVLTLLMFIVSRFLQINTYTRAQSLNLSLGALVLPDVNF